MFENSLPAPLNISLTAGKETTIEVEMQKADGTPREMRYYTYSGLAVDVQGQEYALTAQVAEDRGHVVLVTAPGLPEGEYRYCLKASTDSGAEGVLLEGVIGAYWPDLAGSKAEASVKYPNRHVVVRYPGDGEAGIADWQKLSGIDESLRTAANLISQAQEAVGKLERVDDVLAVLDGTLKEMLSFNPETGTIWIGDYNTGALYRGEEGKSPYLSDSLTWVEWRDGAWRDTGICAQGKDAQPALISNTGTWLIWNMEEGKYEDSGRQAVGRDGIDGTAVRRIIVPSVNDIPLEGETCNGGFYYYVPLEAVAWQWAGGSFDLSGMLAEAEGASWLFVNGEQIPLGEARSVAEAVEAVNEKSDFVVAREAEDGSLSLTAIAPGESGNGLSVGWGNKDLEPVAFPEGTDNSNFNYMELPAGAVRAGRWASVSLACRSSASANMTSEARYLGVWEMDEAGANWVRVGSSLNAVSQAAGQVVTWDLGGMELAGRRLRLTLLDDPGASWQSASFFGGRVSASEAGSGYSVYYNGTAHDYIPQLVWTPAADVDLGSLSGGVDAKPSRYAVYAWCYEGEAASWVKVGEANDLATAEIAGLVKLGTDTVIEEGAVVGENAAGQMMVPRATLTEYGTVKPGSKLPQLHAIPYQQAVGMLDDGGLANNFLFGGALKHMLVSNWEQANMPWLAEAVTENPGNYATKYMYCTGIHTSGQFTQGSGTLELLPATAERLAGVYLATGMSDGRAAAVVTPDVLSNYATATFYTKGQVDSKLNKYVTQDALQDGYYGKSGVYSKDEANKAISDAVSGCITPAGLETSLSGYASKSEAVLSSSVREFEVLKTSEFNALATKDANTIYITVPR